MTAPLESVARHFSALSDRAATLPGGEQLREARQAISARLGFDPLTREGLEAAGIDGERGAAVAFFSAAPAEEWTVAIPLRNQQRFLETAQRILVDRAGFTPAPAQPANAKLFTRSGVRVGLRVARRYGLIARASDPAARLEPPDKEQSLAKAPGLQKARQQLGAQDLIVWAPKGSELPHRYTARNLPGDVAVSAQGSPDGLATRLFAPLPEADAARAREILPGGGGALVELLPADAPLRGRLGIAGGELLGFARRQPDLAPILQRLNGADAEAVAAIAPGLAFSLAVEKTADLGTAIDYGLDFRRRSPFDNVQLVMLAEVTDRPRLAKALASIALALPSLGARVERTAEGFAVTYPAGKGPRFGVREVGGKAVAYLLGGTIRPEDLKRTPRPAAGESAALYEDPGAVVRIDFGRLAAQIAALPESAYGSGPQSYVARSLVSQILEPLRPLRLTLDAQVTQDHFGSSLDVEIAP